MKFLVPFCIIIALVSASFLVYSEKSSELKELLVVNPEDRKVLEDSLKRIVHNQESQTLRAKSNEKKEINSDAEKLRELLKNDPKDAFEQVKLLALDKNLDVISRRKILDAYFEDNPHHDQVIEAMRKIIESCPEEAVLERALDMLLVTSLDPEGELNALKEEMKEADCVLLLKMNQ